MLELNLMQPTAAAYIALFAVTAILYYIIPDITFSEGRSPVNLRNVFLILASIVFIGISDTKFAAVSLAAAVLTWICGRLIGNAGRTPARIILVLHIAAILSAVFILRYHKADNVIVPVGIMIYSLKAIGYTAGIYRGEVDKNTGIADCLLYMLFFPVLMIGPVQQPQSFFDSAHDKHPLKFSNLQEGFLLLLWGFMLKLVLADNIASFTDIVCKEEFAEASGAIVLVTVLLLPIQIYVTFYGLSAAAAGYSRMLGYELPDNFTAPFLASSMTGFRKGWNATLNSWAETNIYEPLTAARKDSAHTGRLYNSACLILMTLFIGLWYGRDTHFLAGAIGLGLYEIIESMIGSRGFMRVVMTPLRFAAVTFAGLLFRSGRIRMTLAAVRKIVNSFDAETLHNGTFYNMGFWPRYWVLIICGIVILLIADICKKKGIVLRKWITQRIFLIRWAVYVSAFVIILIFGCWGFGYDQPRVLCDFMW